ncbi:MAG: hypothetical protein OHK0039_18600 [Bacteroidia bacterium]
MRQYLYQRRSQRFAPHRALRIGSVFVLLLSGICYTTGLHAQVLRGISNKVKMDFGYPDLKVLDDLTFEDENSNQLIDANEVIQISFTIENAGAYPALAVKIQPQELNGVQGLDLPDEIEVGDIPPGEKRKIRVGIAASEQLEKGSASLFFKIIENGSYDNLSVPYGVGTVSR